MKITKVRMKNYNDTQQIEFIQFNKLAILLDKNTSRIYEEYKFDTYTTGFRGYGRLKDYCLEAGYITLKEEIIDINIDENSFNELSFKYYGGLYDVYLFDGVAIASSGESLYVVESKDCSLQELTEMCNREFEVTSQDELELELHIRIICDRAGEIAFGLDKFYMDLTDSIRFPGEVIDGDDVLDRFDLIQEYREILICKEFSTDEIITQVFNTFYDIDSLSDEKYIDSFDAEKVRSLKEYADSLIAEIENFYKELN